MSAWASAWAAARTRAGRLALGSGPGPGWWRVLVGLAGLALALYPLIARDDIYLQNVLILVFLLGIMASGWNIISGLAGYVSLGQSAFLGIGAYTTALLALHLHWSPFLAAPLGGVAAAACAALLGAVVMRTRGHAFVIITIAFLFLAQLIAVNAVSITGGTNGLTLPLPWWSSDYQDFPFYYGMLALLLLAVGEARWIARRKLGAGLVAIREDEGKATTIGVATATYKLLGFAASAVLIGVAGGLYGYYLTFIDPAGMFSILTSVQIVLAGLLGGRGTIWGPVVGAFVLGPVNEATNVWFGTSSAHLLVFGLLLAAVVLWLPNGIVPTVARWLQRLRERSAAPAATPETLWTTKTPPPASLIGWLRGGPQGQQGAGAQEATDAARAPAPATVAVASPEPDPTSAPDAGAALLELRGLCKRFGGLQAVDECSFTVRAGTITGLIGPNGSGKTTIFNLVSGTLRSSGGEVWLAGQRLDGQAPWERAWLGLGRTFQVTRLLKQMTVLQNVVAPLRGFAWRQLSASAVSGPEARCARELLGFVGMESFSDEPAGHLSFGQQKLVELAQVLMLEPRLILLDEPACGVNPRMVERLTELITELNRYGVTFLLVEHNMPMVLGLCDPVVVLARGRPIAEGPPAAVQRDPAVLDAYLGDGWDPSSAAALQPSTSRAATRREA